MTESKIQHLVIIRHGESEGDVRRSMAKEGALMNPSKRPADEEQTKIGDKQSALAGQWIAEHILRAYGIESFDVCLQSPAIRTKQTAEALCIPNAEWQDEPLLAERDRGEIQGFTKQAHEENYPDSYAQMINDPIHWTPPGGESIVDVSERASRLIAKIKNTSSAILVTHRDWIWAAQVPVEGLSESELELVDTDLIHNSQVIHYMNIDPFTVDAVESLIWKRSVCPYSNDITSRQWNRIEND